MKRFYATVLVAMVAAGPALAGTFTTFKSVGSRARGVGKPFTSVGEPARGVGKPFTSVGEPFTSVGEPYRFRTPEPTAEPRSLDEMTRPIGFAGDDVEDE